MGEANLWVGQRTIRPDGEEKVTGKARFGADFSQPGMLWGKVLRSPHPHARILSIDASRAEALTGVKAVITGADLVDFPVDTPVQVGPADMRFVSRNVMARDKALYAGHAVAAVAATSPQAALEALELIDVEYEKLPWVIDVEEAMKPDAPVLHDFLRTDGIEPPPDTPSNIASRSGFTLGDVEAGFAAGGRGDRTELPYPAGAPGLHRTPRLPGQRRRRRARDHLEFRAKATSWCATPPPR